MTARHLSAGQRLRADLDAALPPGVEWDERETALLAVAAAQADDIAALEDLLAQQGPTVTGSTGQERLNPAFAELRQARLALGKLLASLRLPEEGIGAASRNSQQARAARTRWDRERQRRGAG